MGTKWKRKWDGPKGHPDEPEDKALVKKMVKKTALKAPAPKGPKAPAR